MHIRPLASFVALALALPALLVAPPAARAQNSSRLAKIGLLVPTNATATAHFLEALRQGLREHGYVEGSHFVLERRYGESRVELLPQRARELVSLKPDVIVVATDRAIAAVMLETRTIPIVMANSTDPVGMGFGASLSRPGSNVTGLTSITRELTAKRLELLREVAPRLSRVALIWNPDVSGADARRKEADEAARGLRLQLQSVELRRPDDIERAFASVTNGRAEALIVPDGVSALFGNRPLIAGFAQRNRLPSIYAQTEYVQAGGLMAYGPNFADMYRRAASYVDKILRGARPGDLPIEQPTKLELVINLKTAKALGLTIPPSLRLRADQVIE